MNAYSLILSIATAIRDEKLEVILVGNAAAALRGAPVTTDDFDFMFRPTPRNLDKMARVAQALGATVSQPEYPISRFYRISNLEVGLLIDMMGRLDGVKSFESLRSRAEEIFFGDVSLKVADLRDVIKSKRAARRPKDLATLPVLEETLLLSTKK